MFTGIIETLGTITDLRHEQGNLHITVASSIAAELKIDQSVAHNGVCLTVIALADGKHTVTAIEETLSKTSLGDLKTGDLVNLDANECPARWPYCTGPYRSNCDLHRI
jgi:riboflavin synthase